MINVPEITDLDMTFGSIKHMPKQADIPDKFKSHRGTPFNEAVSTWFFSGAKRDGAALVIGSHKFTPKNGVDANKALRAIRAVLGSFEPKHEHKESACAFMLSEWFDHESA